MRHSSTASSRHRRIFKLEKSKRGLRPKRVLVVGPAELLRLSRTQTMTRDVEQMGLFFHLCAPMCASTPRQPRPRCSVLHLQGYAFCLKLKRFRQRPAAIGERPIKHKHKRNPRFVARTSEFHCNLASTLHLAVQLYSSCTCSAIKMRGTAL